MNAQDLRKLLQQTSNKLSIFASSEILSKCKCDEQELLNLIKDFLSDEEKMRLFNYSHFKNFDGSIKGNIIGLVSDEYILLQMLCNDSIMEGVESNQIVDIIKKIGDSGKQRLLNDQDFIQKYQIDEYDLINIISSLTDEARTEILMDVDLIRNKLNIPDFLVTKLVKELSNDESKRRALKVYDDLYISYKVDIITTLNSSSKLDILLGENDFNKIIMMDILSSLDIGTLGRFLAEHKEFCIKNGIHPYYMFIRRLEIEKQKDFVENLVNIDLPLSEKREMLVMLDDCVKQIIDKANLPEEYKSALSIQRDKYQSKIILDLERNLEDYRGLDNVIIVNPQGFTEEQRAKFIKVCEICPNLQVVNTFIQDGNYEFLSTGSEYKEAEEWINSLIDGLNPEYSEAQKLAVIDNAIGNKISYSPDFETEVFDINDCRALWKIISSGYGVCNGIAGVEQYILDRVGIESEVVYSNTHAFLKIYDIELPLADGKTVKGNTILDPTWNLAAHRFGGMPNNFCINYEQARKNDINRKGKDTNCHKNDEKLQDVTLGLDEQSLRMLFTSVGLADRDGQFPIKALQEKSEYLDAIYGNRPEKNISQQFLLLSQTCPEFATCQNESMSILSGTLLNNKNLIFTRCAVNRVYDRMDDKKRPVLFVYIDLFGIGARFYYADKDEGQFIGLTQEEFTKKFECYETDLKDYGRN